MLVRWNVAFTVLSFLLDLRCCLCTNYSTSPPSAVPSKFSPPPLPTPPLLQLVNGPPIRMQFTIEWTNLTQFFLGQHQQANSSAWTWHKTRAEGWTGSRENSAADGDVNLEEIFPESSKRQANQSQQTTIKPTTTFTAKNTKPSISAVVAMNIMPQKNFSIYSQPNKIAQKMVVPSIGTTKMTTILRTTTTTTTTTAKIISTTTPSTATKESPLAKTTQSGGKKIMQMINISTSNLGTSLTISTSSTPISISTTTTIPLPFRLRFLLTRRIRPLMIMRKMAPLPPTTIQSAMFSSAFTTPKMLMKPYSISQITPSPKPPSSRIILHDIGRMAAKPSPIPLADAPGLSPKPPGTHQPMPIVVESRKYLPIANTMNFGPSRPNNNRGRGCERREIDGDTQKMANKGKILMRKYGTNCGSTLRLNQQQQMPQRMPLPTPPMNGILTPQQEMTFKLAIDPMDEGGNGCSCRPHSLAQSFGFRPIPNKCCRRQKCFDCPTIVDHDNSTLPSPMPINSTIHPFTTMAPIVLPMPTVWENPNKKSDKHKALGLS